MNRIQASEQERIEPTGPVEHLVIDPHEVDPSENVGATPGSGLVVRADPRTTSARLNALDVHGRRRRRYARSADDSGSASTSLTIADASR